MTDQQPAISSFFRSVKSNGIAPSEPIKRSFVDEPIDSSHGKRVHLTGDVFLDDDDDDLIASDGEEVLEEGAVKPPSPTALMSKPSISLLLC